MTYQLTTLADVFNKVPADKIELCMAEIGSAMAMSKMANDGFELQGTWPDVTEWVDDGKGESGFEFTDKDGKNIIAVKMTKEGK